MTPQWYELLMQPDSDLRRYGLPARRIAEMREAQTGHRRSLIPKWCRSIGLWGRVATQVEIEVITGATPKATRRFAENWGLRFAGKYGRTSQFRLAVKVYEEYRNLIDDGQEYDPVRTAQNNHILPIEAVLYPMAVEEFVTDQERGDLFELASSFEENTLAEMWVNSNWVVGLPERVALEIGGGDDRLTKRIHRRFGRNPTTQLRRTARPSTSSS